MGNCLVSLVWGMLDGKGWGIYAWPVVGMVDSGSLADECGLLGALVLSHTSRTPSVPVFPIPIGPIVSLPYFPYPFVPLISHNNDNCAPTPTA